MKAKNRKTISYSASATCPDCNGQLAYDSRITDSLPLGFGFAGSSRFQIDVIKRSGFGGECFDCGRKVFAVQRQRRVTKYPHRINAKLAAMR